MYFKPAALSDTKLENDELKADKAACKKIGPCGIGPKALYLNSVFLDRRFYVPISRVKRAYKKIAMSKGGYSGKGMFGSIAYLVVEFDGDKTVQCRFKFEDKVDAFLAAIAKDHPEIKTVSAAAAKRLEKARAEEAKLYVKNLSDTANASVESLTKARTYLESRQELCDRLAAASKAKRINAKTNPAYKWVAITILAAGAVAAVYGGYCLITKTGSFGLYFLLLGLAFVFLFSGASVRPTGRRNAEAIDKQLADVRAEMAAFLAEYSDFPLPARYAHPVCLTRMIRSIRQGRAETVPDAYEDLKKGLQALNASVQVSQAEYDEVVKIKPMFLVENYQ